MTTLLAYALGSLALAAGTGLVVLALVKMEQRERKGWVTWKRDSRR